MSDPKNKWSQPPAPPAPMFFGKKERDLVKQVNDELSERIIGQPIAYYPISIEESNFNETYGEAVEKISLPPVRVFAYVVVDNEQTNERYGYEYQTKLTVNFHRRRLVEDQDLYVRVGDFVQYGEEFYEIVRLYDDTRYLFGQVEHKFQVAAECVKARRGVFRVMPGIDRPVTEEEADGSPDAPAPRPAPYPPLTATYITVTADTKLPNERVLTAGDGITLTDGGANSTITIAASGQNAVGPTGSIQFQLGAGSFSGSSNVMFLTASNTLSITGDLTASTLVSSSAMHASTMSASLLNLSPTSGSLAGLGSYLGLDSNNNIILTSSLGSGTGDGIFTLINGTSAFVTSSLAIGGTSAPDHKLAISGSISASVNVSASAFYGDGSNLSGITTEPAGATTQLQYNDGGAFAGSTNLTFNGVTLTGSYTGSLAEFTTLSASALQVKGNTVLGDASADSVTINAQTIELANIAAGTDNTVLVYNGSSIVTDEIDPRVWGSTLVDASGTPSDNQVGIWTDANTMEGVSALTFDGSVFTVVGSITASADITASTITVGSVVGGSPLSLTASSFNVTGAFYTAHLLSSSAHISASAFYGDGSNLSNLPAGGLLTAINGSSAYLTSSLALGGTSAPDHALSISGSVSASINMSASAFYGNGADLTSLTIGAAEDASYADGLFTDFGTTTPVGTAVDRFNEILKALSPGPAPNLDDIDCDDSGVSAELSFGSSQPISGYENVGTTAGFSAVDINGTYGTSTSSNNLRRGTFNGSRLINGDLNEDVSADGTNYPANSFGDADKGELRLEVNGATLHTASMSASATGTGVPGSGTGTDLNGNGSGFYSLSQTGSANFDDGTELDLFQHRTGKYKVVAADQREGWNYLRVIHTSSAFSRTTNYAAWVNDSNSDALAASASALDTLSMSGDLRLSGVKYHTGGTAQYRVAVNNAYKNVYTSTNISYTVTNGSISSVSMPSISVGTEDESKVLMLTGSLTVDGTSILNSSIGAGVNVAHPLKSNLSNGGAQTISSILAYNRTNNSTSTSETFRRENYRLVSGSLSSYAAQADVVDAGNAWDSSGSLVSSDGLLFYNQRLYSPIDNDVPNNGNFSTIANGPGSNVNYSSISGTRTFFRYFTNTGAASQTNFELSFTGDSSSRIVPSSTALSTTNIHVFVKLPNTSASKTTGWLDLGAATANDPAQLSNFDGCYVGTPAAGGLQIDNDSHEATLVTQTVEQNENIVVKIVADAAWTGYISALSISWG